MDKNNERCATYVIKIAHGVLNMQYRYTAGELIKCQINTIIFIVTLPTALPTI